jgi:hypothetical protein
VVTLIVVGLAFVGGAQRRGASAPDVTGCEIPPPVVPVVVVLVPVPVLVPPPAVVLGLVLGLAIVLGVVLPPLPA